jgi:hypothetical protein
MIGLREKGSEKLRQSIDEPALSRSAILRPWLADAETRSSIDIAR